MGLSGLKAQPQLRPLASSSRRYGGPFADLESQGDWSSSGCATLRCRGHLGRPSWTSRSGRPPLSSTSFRPYIIVNSTWTHISKGIQQCRTKRGPPGRGRAATFPTPPPYPGGSLRFTRGCPPPRPPREGIDQPPLSRETVFCDIGGLDTSFRYGVLLRGGVRSRIPQENLC